MEPAQNLKKTVWPGNDQPLNFLNTPLAPIYTIFERGARTKKNVIFVQTFSKKSPKTAFWPVSFLQKLQKKFGQRGVSILSSENHFGRLKKKEKSRKS